MATLADSLVSSTSRKLSLRVRPDLTARSNTVLGRRLLGGQGTGGTELLPLSRGGVRDPADAGRPDQPGADQGTVRRGIRAAEDHLPGSAAVHRHAAPQRAGDLRVGRARAGNSANAATRRNARSCWAKLSNVFAIRFRGVDPERFLNWMYRSLGGCSIPSACFSAWRWRSALCCW
jgi:putative peptide zinc metalloprotease protein